MITGFNEATMLSEGVFLTLEKMVATSVNCPNGTSVAPIGIGDLTTRDGADDEVFHLISKLQGIHSLLHSAIYSNGASVFPPEDPAKGFQNNPAVRYLIANKLLESIQFEVSGVPNFKRVFPIIASLPINALISMQEILVANSLGEQIVVTTQDIVNISEWLQQESINEFLREFIKRVFEEINSDDAFKHSGVTADLVSNCLARIRANIISATEMMG